MHCNTLILIKVGEVGQSNSFLVEVKWTQSYPEEIPEVSLDSFFNNHLYVLMKGKLV